MRTRIARADGALAGRVATATRIAVLCLGLAVSSQITAGEAEDSVVVYRSPYDFETTRDNVADAILAQGLIISETLHIGDMLNRTGAVLGITQQIYVAAESLTFCSATVTHSMLASDPHNIVNCPFSIAVYVLTGEPSQVYLAFQRPDFVGDASDANRAAFELMDAIVQEAIL